MYEEDGLIDILCLPDNVIVKLFDYLHIDDILNLRLTCITFYNHSQSKEFYGKVKVALTCVNSDFTYFLTNFLKFGEMFVRINMENFRDIQSVLSYLKNVTDVRIDMEHLPFIAKYCTKLSRLEIVLDFDIFVHPDSYFKCLEKLNVLSELHLEGVFGIPTLWILYIVKWAKSIKEICLENMKIYRSSDDEYNSLFKEILRGAKHIKHWKFVNVDCADDLVELGSIDLTLTVKHSIYKNINFKNAVINKFCLDAIDYYHNPSLKFSNLKSLELCNMYIGYIKKYQLLCPNLEVLKLDNTQYTGVFLEELIPLFKNSLTELMLKRVQDIDDEHIKLVRRECQSLQRFYINNVLWVTKSCLEEVIVNSTFKVFVA